MRDSGKNEASALEQAAHESDTVRIAEDIAKNIRDGVWSPGTRLPSEGKLTAHYKSNVYCIRKAIARMKAQGLLYSVPKFGVFVREAVAAPQDFSASPLLESQETVSLSFATRGRLKPQQELWKQIARAFARKSPFAEMRTVFPGEEGAPYPDFDLFEEVSLSSSYLAHRELLNVREYFPEAIRNAEQMLDSCGIPFYYVTPVLLYNLDLLEELGFSAPAYRGFEEQMLFLEQVTDAALKKSGMQPPGAAQTVIIRLGSHIRDIFRKIKDRKLNEKTFASEYGDLFHRVTDYWRRYHANYSGHSTRKTFIDFVSGNSPFFLGMTSNYTRLLETAPPFRYGGAMVYAADDTCSRILVVLGISAATKHPVECLRLARQFQEREVQQRIAELGGLPLSEAEYCRLPYHPFIRKEQAAPPLYFQTPEEHYVCMNIINEELWNVILFHKNLNDAMSDALMFSESYLKMRLNGMTDSERRSWSALYEQEKAL